ncbi:MAG: acyl-CoA reductase [Sphingobacteriaceae bacterium]
MQIKQRINAFVQVGDFINRHFKDEARAEEANLHLGLKELVKVAKLYNGWFDEAFVNHAIQNIGSYLNEKSLNEISSIISKQEKEPKVVAIICAGNIPMVGFHDILCVLLSGNIALIKMSSDDNVLLPFFLKLLTHYEPAFDQFIRMSEGKLTNFNAIIATGSNNTSSHFEYYFAKYPHIIRKNRSSLAVLTGNETPEEIKQLGKDIFYYYGLGCRNVSKLLVPESYDFKNFFEGIFEYSYILENKKYGNNYDYNRAIYLLNKADFLDNNFVMLKSDNQIHAPISVVFYERYKTTQDVQDHLLKNKQEIQCVVGEGYIPFGNSQSPVITDFADGVNTMEFLVNL